MSATPKTEFLEKYACLILLNYTRVSELDSAFHITASMLQKDPDPEICANALLAVKMVDMYREERRSGSQEVRKSEFLVIPVH